jgi:hypothetical protein
MRLFGLLSIICVILAACDGRDKETVRRDYILASVAGKISVRFTPIGRAQKNDEEWYDYQTEIFNESPLSVYLSGNDVVSGEEFYKVRNEKGLFYSIETDAIHDGLWRDASIGIAGHNSHRMEVPPKTSVTFTTPVRLSWISGHLDRDRIRVSIRIYADNADPNGVKISSPPLSFPPK